MPRTISPVVNRIKEFADLRWPDRDLPGRLRKLGEEIGEVNEAAARLYAHLSCPIEDTEAFRETYLDLLAELTTEIGDAAIVLQDILIITGVDGDLMEVADAKMEVNERREWPVEEIFLGPDRQ